MRVKIDGKDYEVNELRQETVPNPTNGVDAGALERLSWTASQVSRKGIGWQHADRITGNGVGGLRDVDAETRWRYALTAPLNDQSETHASPADHLVAYEHYKGDLWALFEQEYASGSGTRQALTSAKYNASNDTWEGSHFPTFNSASTGNSATSPLTVSHTTQSTFGNRIVIAHVAINTSGAPSSVTYGGQAMTQAVERSAAPGDASIWYLVNPPTGANNCVVSHATGTEINAVVEDWYHVNQTTPFGTTSEGSGTTSTSASLNVDCDHGDTIVGNVYVSDNGAITVGSGQTQSGTVDDGSNRFTASYELMDTTSATNGHNYTWSVSSNHVTVAAPLNGDGVLTATESDATGVRAFGWTTHKGSLYAIGTKGFSNETQYRWYSTTDGSTWADGSGSNWPTTAYVTTTTTRRNDFTDKHADILDNGSQLIVALYEDPDSTGGSSAQVHIGYSTDAGTSWTFNSGLVIPCTTTPNVHLRHIRDIYSSNSQVVPALVISSNVFLLDTTNNTFQRLLNQTILTGTSGEALAAETGADGGLYVSKESGDILRIAIPSPGEVEVINCGPATNPSGGLVSARSGHATFIDGTDPSWLIVAYGGHAAGKNASILMLEYDSLRTLVDGDLQPIWHSFFKDSTANRECHRVGLSSEDDGVLRLHAATEAADSSVMYMFEEVNTTPASGTTLNVRTGYLELARDGLGDDAFDTAIFEARLAADGLDETTAGNYVSLSDGFDGNAYTTNDRGDFLSGDKDLTYASGAGATGKTVGLRLDITINTSSSTPEIFSLDVLKQTNLHTKDAWLFVVDLTATSARHSHNHNPEAVRSALTTIRDNGTAVSVIVGGDSAKNMVMERESFNVELAETSGGNRQGISRINGTATFIMREVV